MYDIAIIASVIPERLHLLERSLLTWKAAIAHSNLKATIGLAFNGIHAPEKFYTENIHCSSTETRAGSHIWGYNHLSQRIDAKVYLFTHPEILFPQNTLRTAYELSAPDTFSTFKVFWLPQQMTIDLDKYDWEHPENLEQQEALYQHDPKEHGEFYWNTDVRANRSWESTTTYALDAATMHRLFPFPDLGHQGYDDPLHHSLRQLLGIKTFVVPDPILFHQWHPQTWDGNHEQAVLEATQLTIDRIKAMG